jgi:3-oxoadipate enol-lactonase
MPQFDHDGVQISYWDHGGGEPAVILAHGFLMDHTMFDPQVAALAPEFRVITWDERGFGATVAPTAFTFWDSASDVIALLDHLGIERAVVGGMSQGGFLSLRTALAAPERVQGLVLIDTQAGVEDPATLEGYNALRDAWMEHGPAPVQDTVASLILGPGDWADWFAKWAELDRKQFSLAYDCLVERDDVTGRLGEISCPSLIIHGTDDVAITIDKGEQLRDGLGGPATLVAVPGGPHAANLTHPDVVNPALLEFLRAL